MQIDQMKTQVTTLKLYMNKMEEFMRQAGIMIYDLEEKLMEIEEELYYQKYEIENSIKKMNEAATQTLGLARQGIDRCIEQDIELASFIQQFSKINASNTKRS